MTKDMYEQEILTRKTPRDRLNAFIELMARYEHWPHGSANADRVQAQILRDLAQIALLDGKSIDLDAED